MPRGLESETLHAWGGGRRLAASAAELFRCSEFAWEVRYLVWCMGAVCGVRCDFEIAHMQRHAAVAVA